MQKNKNNSSNVNPFHREETGVTFSELIAKVRESRLDHSRRRDLISAINRYVKVTETIPSNSFVRVAEIRQKLLEIEPARFEMSRKTWSNVKSNLLAAVELAGAGPVLKTAKVKLAPAWRDLLALIPDRRTREGLSRFMRFCSANGVLPGRVDLNVLAQFETALHEGSFARKALTIKRDVATLWNRLAERFPDGGLATLELASRRAPPTRIPLGALPCSFRDDLRAHLEWAAMQDPFAENARRRPLSRRSLRLREQYVLSAVTALVNCGLDPADIRCLADLTSPSAFKRILTRRLKGTARSTAYNEGLAKALVAMAKEWVRPTQDVLEELRRLKSKLPPLALGLTEKNKAVLREFSDPKMLERLLALPEQLWEEADRRAFSFRAFADYEAALGIWILTYAPLRSANLAALEFGRTLRLPSRRGLCALIDIPGEEMKAGQPYMIELPPALTNKLMGFIDRLRQEYGRAPKYLFETRAGQHKPASTLSWLIKRKIRKDLGINMTAHQFRHVMGDLLLSDEPSASSFETARQLLGHRNLSTTVKYYTGQNTMRAGRRHHELIQTKRTQAAATSPKRIKRLRRKTSDAA